MNTSCKKLVFIRSFFVSISLVLVACGGGGSGSGSGPNYVTWTNNANGTVIKDGANNNFSVDTSTRNVVALASNTTLTGLTVDNNGNVIDNGTTIATVDLIYSTSGTKIEKFDCSGPAPQYGAMTISVTGSVWSYTCASNTGSSSSSGSNSSSANYTSWTGSANGTTIMDAASNQFAVYASTRDVIALTPNTILTGLTVNTSAQVLYNGSVIGTVSPVTSTSGSSITEFYCSAGSPMTITVGSTWSTSCGGSGSTSSSSSGSSGTTYDGINASNCVSISGNHTLTNTCNVTIYVDACATNAQYPVDICQATSIGGGLYDYGRSSWALTPGTSSNSFFFGTVTGQVVWFACATGPSGIEPFPFITQVSPVLGVCH